MFQFSRGKTHVARLLAMLAASCLATPPAPACSTWSGVVYDLRVVELAAESFRTARGDWPRDDGVWRWFEHLATEPDAQMNLELFEYDACGPLDRWGHPIIFEPPPIGAPTGGAPIIRSMGANGIDERGLGDDLTLGRPVNAGSYGRPSPHAFVVFSSVSPGVLSLLIAVWRLRSGRFRGTMLSVIGAWLGLSCMMGANLLWPSRSCCGRLFSPARELSDIGSIIFALTCLVSFIAFIVTSAREGMASARFAERLEQHLCTTCGYDLNGLPQHRCPECGHENTRPVSPVVLSNQFIPVAAAPPRSAPHQSDPA